MNRVRQKLKSWGINRDIFMLGLARMIDSLSASLLIILIPLYVKELQVSFVNLPPNLLIGILLSTFGVSNFVTQPGAGIWVDRTGRHLPFLLSGLGIYACCTGLFIWSQSFTGMFFLRMAQGISVALTIPATLSLMTIYTVPEQRGTAMGFYNMMRMFGFGLGPVPAGYLVESIGFDGTFLLGFSCSAIGVVLIALLVREPDRDPGIDPEGMIVKLKKYIQPEMYDFLKLALGNISIAISISLISSLQNVFNARLNQDPSDFGLAYSSLLIPMVVLQIPVGRVADRYGRKLPIVLGLLLLVPVTVWMPFVQNTTQFVICRLLQGVAVAGVFAPSIALSGDKSGSGQRGQQLSILSMAFVLGVGIGPAMGGLFTDFLSFPAPFIITAALSAVSALVIALTVTESDLAVDERL